jgi:hypothetical protein
MDLTCSIPHEQRWWRTEVQNALGSNGILHRILTAPWHPFGLAVIAKSWVHKPFRQKDSAGGFRTTQGFYALATMADYCCLTQGLVTRLNFGSPSAQAAPPLLPLLTLLLTFCPGAAQGPQSRFTHTQSRF